MRRWFTVAAIIGLLATAVAVAPARAAGCRTQGDLAVALAQLLDLAGPGVTAGEAATALEAIGVKPAAGWDLAACLDDTTVAQVDQALAGAIAAQLLDQKYSGSVASALAVVEPDGAGSGDGGGAPGVSAGPYTGGKTYNPPVSPHRP